MSRKMSFTKYQSRILPEFRNQCNLAESTEDLKKVFRQSSCKLMRHVFCDEVVIDSDDITLIPGSAPFFRLNERLMTIQNFSDAWQDSDLSSLLGNLAKSAVNRYRHLEKHPEKTRSKIRM